MTGSAFCTRTGAKSTTAPSTWPPGRIAELLLHGCTTTRDQFYLFPPQSDGRLEAVLAAAAELGIRMHVCRGSMSLGQSRGGLPPDDCVERDADVLADCERVLDAYHDPAPDALRRIDLAPCSPFNVTRELLRDTRALARARGVLLHTHLAETLDAQAYCLARFGCRPVQYLADLDWLGPDVYLAHCVWLDDAELELLARTRTAVSLCPTSNLRLGSGLPRLADLRARGVRLGLGVDGSSSNDGGNLLAEAKQALLVGRMPPVLTQSSAPWLSAAEALWLATRGGPRACTGPNWAICTRAPPRTWRCSTWTTSRWRAPRRTIRSPRWCCVQRRGPSACTSRGARSSRTDASRRWTSGRLRRNSTRWSQPGSRQPGAGGAARPLDSPPAGTRLVRMHPVFRTPVARHPVDCPARRLR